MTSTSSTTRKPTKAAKAWPRSSPAWKLAPTEGTLAGAYSAFYDLFRLANTKVVEHWDTIEPVAPRSEWKNDNGKF
jgi:hypothetical protein